MIVNVIPTPKFKREAKRLIKKYASLKTELQTLATELQQTPEMGVRIGEDTYKIRLAVKSKGKGKSGGLRIITHVFAKIVNETNACSVYLLSIYDKSEFDNVSNHIIMERIQNVKLNFDVDESNGEPEETSLGEEE